MPLDGELPHQKLAREKQERKATREANALARETGALSRLPHQGAVIDVQSERLAQDRADDPGDLDDTMDEVEEFARVLGELDATGAGANVKIWRINQIAKTKSFVDEILPQEFSLKWLMDNYGGGVYRIMVYVPQRDPETGALRTQVKLAANKQIVIDGPAKIRREETANVPAVSQSNEVLLMGLNKMGEMMAQGFTGLAAVIAQNQPKPQSMMETIQIMTAMKAFIGGGEPRVDPMQMLDKALKTVASISEVTALARGGDEDGGGGLGNAVVMKLLGRFMEAYDAAPTKPAPAAPVLPEGGIALPGTEHLNVVPNPTDKPAPAAQAQEESENMGLGMLRLALGEAVREAERNTPVAELADSVYDDLPANLFEFLQQPDWWEQVQVAAPRARLYPVWFKDFRAELLRLDAEDGEPEA